MKPTLNQEFTITRQWTADSKSPKTLGIPTIHIIFKGVLDHEEYRTYIVEGFKNIKLWEDILCRPYKQLMIRFPEGRHRGYLIDADSEPEIVTTRDQLQSRLNDIFE